MRVQVDTQDGCVFPKLCPCCMGAADQVENIRGSSPAGVYDVSASVEVPVCSVCLAHRREGWAPARAIAGTGITLLLLALLLRGAFDVRQGSIGYIVAELLGMLSLLSLLLAVSAYFWVRWKWPRKHPPHVRTGKAVAVLPGAVLNWTLFVFANEEYGRLFREANASRLTSVKVE